MKIHHRNTVLKQMMNPRHQIVELGTQLGLNMEQIDSILKEPQHTTEYLNLSVGPPHYCGTFYGSVSINDFSFLKK